MCAILAKQRVYTGVWTVQDLSAGREDSYYLRAEGAPTRGHDSTPLIYCSINGSLENVDRDLTNYRIIKYFHCQCLLSVKRSLQLSVLFYDVERFQYILILFFTSPLSNRPVSAAPFTTSTTRPGPTTAPPITCSSWHFTASSPTKPPISLDHWSYIAGIHHHIW